jgi:hypothetical protein
MSKGADPALSTLAEQNGLGPFRARHAVFGEAYKKGLGLLASGLLLPAAIAVYILAPQAVPLWGVLLVAVLGIAGLVMGSLLFFPLLFLELQSHERGFVYKSSKGIEVVPYAEVIGVQARVTTTTERSGGSSSVSRSGQLNAYLRDGRMVAVNPNLEDIQKFMDEMVQGAAPAVVEAARNTVASGKVFSCGAITLGPEGLTVEGKTYPFAAKLSVYSDFDETRVSVKGKTVAKLRTQNVINAPYLEHVLKAAKSTQVEDDSVRIGLEVIAAHDALDGELVHAVKAIVPADWPVVVVEMGISRQLDNLVVMDRNGASMLPPNAELMSLGNRVAQIHAQHKTGANRVRLTLRASDNWSVDSEFLKVG